jgi:hypothetical protein
LLCAQISLGVSAWVLSRVTTPFTVKEEYRVVMMINMMINMTMNVVPVYLIFGTVMKATTLYQKVSRIGAATTNVSIGAATTLVGRYNKRFESAPTLEPGTGAIWEYAPPPRARTFTHTCTHTCTHTYARTLILTHAHTRTCTKGLMTDDDCICVCVV